MHQTDKLGDGVQLSCHHLVCLSDDGMTATHHHERVTACPPRQMACVYQVNSVHHDQCSRSCAMLLFSGCQHGFYFAAPMTRHTAERISPPTNTNIQFLTLSHRSQIWSIIASDWRPNQTSLTLIQGWQVWLQSGSDWLQMGEILDFSKIIYQYKLVHSACIDIKLGFKGFILCFIITIYSEKQ